MSGAGLAIFVKTPTLSPVKTRLWPQIGQRTAEAFHLAAAEAVASVAQCAQADTQLTTYWAVAEPEALQGHVWSEMPKLPQGAGSLGMRMHHVYQQLLQQHTCALLIGADAPQIVPNALVRAAQWLQVNERRLVIGLARDGGFWLFGGNVPLPEVAWLQVTYSRSHTAANFLRSMRPHGRWLELDTLGDVDAFDDFVPVLADIRALRHPTAAQQRLATWMQEVIARMREYPWPSCK